MSYSIFPTDNFKKEVKKLARKHRSIKNDLVTLQKELLNNPTKGTHLGQNVYKIRMPIASKDKGKSGGARVISYILTRDEEIYLLSVYDKSKRPDISDNEIKKLINNI